MELLNVLCKAMMVGMSACVCDVYISIVIKETQT